jgi:two-component system, OmpR family, response regulator CpxR
VKACKVIARRKKGSFTILYSRKKALPVSSQEDEARRANDSRLLNEGILVNRILVIDDDIELCELLTEYLQPEGFHVETVNQSEPGIDRALSGEHSLVVLDVMLPKMSGFEVLRRIRSSSNIPVLMLTARGEEIDRIVGLEMGADDYLPKPFNPRELVARLRAIGRRTESTVQNPEGKSSVEVLVVGDLVLETKTRVVRKDGNEVAVTAAEFSLLQELLRMAGQVVGREELAENVLGRKLSMFDRSIDVHVSSLRKKLGAQRNGLERIKTIRSVGYMYAKVPGND